MIKIHALCVIFGVLAPAMSYHHSNLHRLKDSTDFTIQTKFMRNKQYYTQGLYYNTQTDRFIESSGGYGTSTIQVLKLDSKSVSVEKSVKLDRKYFGEGCDSLKDTDGKTAIFQLTWQAKKIFRYDEDLKLIETFNFPGSLREGWGLTHKPGADSEVYYSDGSSNIYVCDPWDKFKIKRTLHVTTQGYAQGQLNELEYINGYIWANVYMYNYIVVIDPSNGDIVKRFDLTKIYNDANAICRQQRGHSLYYDEVLNGIAYNPTTGNHFITGKNWPVIYEMKFGSVSA